VFFVVSFTKKESDYKKYSLVYLVLYFLCVLCGFLHHKD
jgi:uncharacterized membrane protein